MTDEVSAFDDKFQENNYGMSTAEIHGSSNTCDDVMKGSHSFESQPQT